MILIKSGGELKKMRESGRIAAEVMDRLGRMVKPGLRLKDMEDTAAELFDTFGVRSAFKGYRGYPANICVSINEEVVHGIPGGRTLKDGDIVSMDVGVERDGYYGDMARTLPVGGINGEKARLIRVASVALADGICAVRAGNRVVDISRAIEFRATQSGFSVVRDFVGHGIGSALHEDPQIPNYVTSNPGPVLKPGMTFAIEVMINMGTYHVQILPDGWTAVAKDGKPSAHFEDTVAVTESEPEVLTCLKRKRQ